MPDWRRLVSRRLRSLDVPPARREEIVREVAAFLEDLYEDRRRQGDCPRTARRAAIAGAGSWSDVARGIERVEGSVERRLRTLWLPGLGLSAAVMGLLFVVARSDIGVQIVWRAPGPPIAFYWPWLAALPLLGAAGAAWSRSVGGDRFERALVAIFPALGFLALFLVAGLALPFRQDLPPGEKLAILLVGALNWVALPAAALLLGSVVSTRTARLRPD